MLSVWACGCAMEGGGVMRVEESLSVCVCVASGSLLRLLLVAVAGLVLDRGDVLAQLRRRVRLGLGIRLAAERGEEGRRGEAERPQNEVSVQRAKYDSIIACAHHCSHVHVLVVFVLECSLEVVLVHESQRGGERADRDGRVGRDVVREAQSSREDVVGLEKQKQD